MKKFVFSLISLAFLATSAQAQPWVSTSPPPPVVSNGGIGGGTGAWFGPSIDGSEMNNAGSNVTVHATNAGAVTNDCATLTIIENATATVCPVGWTQKATTHAVNGASEDEYLCFIQYSSAPSATYTIQGTAANVFGWTYINYHPANGVACNFDAALASASSTLTGPVQAVGSLTTTHNNALFVAAGSNLSAGGTPMFLPMTLAPTTAGTPVYGPAAFNLNVAAGNAENSWVTSAWQIKTAAALPAFGITPGNNTNNICWLAWDIY